MRRLKSEIIKLYIVKFLYRFLNAMLSIVRKALFPGYLPENPSRVLIYRIGQIGDILCSIPAIIAVRERFPNAHIALLTTPVARNAPGAKELLHGADFLDDLIVYYHDEIESWRGILTLVKSLREKRYDLFIEFPDDLGTSKKFLRDIFFSKAIGCKYAIGFRLNTLHTFIKAQAKHLQFEDEVKRLLTILADEGISNSGVHFSLPITQNDVDMVNIIFSNYGLDGNKNYIAMNPGAKRPTNRWPKERYAEVGKILAKKYKYKILITGGPGDAELARWIANEIGESAFVIAGKTSLMQSAELLKRCKVLITNDTGTMHLATAVGIPVVAIFSARDFPGKWYPYGTDNVILRENVDCEVCYRLNCDSLKCLNMISVDKVLEAVRKTAVSN